MYENIIKKANDLKGQIVAWRRDFHQNPELSNHEVQTTAKIAKILTDLGYTVKVGTKGHPGKKDCADDAKISIIASGSTIGVLMEYGWIELTRIPNSPSSIASALVIATRPCLDAE